MSRPTIAKITDQYPIGSRVIYRNYGGKGHGNIATVYDYLISTKSPEKVAAIQLQFDSSGMHIVMPNQLYKYYHLIDCNTKK